MATKRGAGGEPQYYDEKSGKYGSGDESSLNPKTDKLARKWESRTIRAPDGVSHDSLTKSEWAEYYKKLGEIKAGTLKARKTKSGEQFVIVGKSLIVDNGSFETPKAKRVVKFRSRELLFRYVERIERGDK